MTIALKGDTEILLRNLLGGKKATPKRVAELLGKLQAAESGGRPEPFHAGEEAPEPVAPVVAAAPAVEAPPDPAQAKLIAMLEQQAKVIASLQTTIEEMRTPTETDPEKLVAVGKLPTIGIGAPKSIADLPVGEWVKSPVGPNVWIKICGCSQCSPHRQFHYYCSVCRSGPHPHQAARRPFSKQWLFPGGFSGVSHYCCTFQCQMTYLAGIGGIANAPAAPMPGELAGAAALTRPTVPEGSD